MGKLKNFITNKSIRGLSLLALTVAITSMQGFCFYIFHQPKMPEGIKDLRKK